MSMQITIKNVKNASKLDDFEPVTGEWYLDGSSEDRSFSGVEQSVRNWMDSEHELTVGIFHMDGREITGDMPSEGTFLARRK